jgi:hypothetical protein
MTISRLLTCRGSLAAISSRCKSPNTRCVSCLSHAFAGQAIGIKEVAEKIWLVTFMHYDLGFFDHETGRVECAPNPFEAQVSPMLRNNPLPT